MTRRKYAGKRQLIDVDAFLAKADDSYLMCINGGVLYALRKMAAERLMWASSWVKSRHQTYYILPGASEWNEIEELLAEFIQESEVIEMCNSALIDALEDIASAVRLSSCCGSGPGGQQIDDDFYFGTATPVSAPTAFGPGEEFESEAAYDSHRCETANGIVNGVVGSLNAMSVLTLAQLTAGALITGVVVGIGLLAVPPVAILLALAFTAFAFGGLVTLASEIDDNKETLVCLLYNASGAVEAYDDFKEAVEGLSVDLGFIEIEVGALSDLIMNLAPIDTMNALFTAVGLPAIPGDTVDCSTACESSEVCVNVAIGDVVDSGEGYIEVASVASDKETLAIYFGFTLAEEVCSGAASVTITVTAGSPINYSASDTWLVFNHPELEGVYASDTKPSNPVGNVGYVVVRADLGEDFTILFEYEPYT